MVFIAHVVSVERYHYYVQYSTLISCRECRKMHFNRYMNGTMLFKVHVVSVKRCIFNRYMNGTMLFKVHVVSVERHHFPSIYTVYSNSKSSNYNILRIKL